MLWEEIAHPEHEQSSVAEMLEHERTHLMPMPEPFDGYVEKPARVSSTCLVAVARNRYSVPCELAGQMVSTRLYPGRVVVVAHDSVVAGHERLHAAGQTRYDWQHYLPLLQRKPGALRNGAQFAAVPAPLQQLRQALLRHAGICSRSVLIFSRSRSVLASTSAAGSGQPFPAPPAPRPRSPVRPDPTHRPRH
jgi:hypothetical protein